MRRRLTLLLFVFSVALKSAMGQGPVHFADETLKAAVEDALWLYDPTPADMLGLRELSCVNQGVTDITGLEFAENLQNLNLRFNEISDISLLAGLGNLQVLSLSRNKLSDLSPLSGLDSLRYLDLHGNQLTNISVVSGLRDLRTLILRFNRLSDIAALSLLHNLRSLDMHENRLSDISALAGLTKLENLDLYDNQITDISVLSRLTALRSLDLRYNRVADISVLSHFPDLAYLYLGNNDIRSIDALDQLTQVRDLYLRGNAISDITALLGMMKLQTLDLRWNPVDTDSFCDYLNVIVQNNPGIVYFYDNDLGCDVSGQSVLAPIVGSDAATAVTEFSAVLNARVVSDGGEACEGRFRYWASDLVEVVTPWQGPLHAGMGYTERIIDLTPNRQYYFTAELRNSAGKDVSGTDHFSSVKERFTLTLLSSPGGTVVDPGQGTFEVDGGANLAVLARALHAHSLFLEWTGTAVDAGAVADPYDPNTFVEMNDNHTLKANFLENVSYVDDDAPSDPGPGDPGRSDPQEDGTAEHPYDSIQEAIAGVTPGATVLVNPGTYFETVNLLGKRIHVTGLDPARPTGRALPVLSGERMNETILVCDQGEDNGSQVSGFILTGGRGSVAGAIACLGSSPTIRNCLIVGNRCADAQGATVYCEDGRPVFENLTVHGNDAGSEGAAFKFISSQAVMTNSILWDNLPGEIVVGSGDAPDITYCNVKTAWPGPGNIAIDPAFAWPGYWTESPQGPQAAWIPGNYHLMSQSGRWDPDSLAWVSDPQTSACIDAGDPDQPVNREPLPNGKRKNMGVYGGTAQASRSSVSALAHWRFDEVSGNMVTDSVGYCDGRVYGAQWTTGKIAGALQFDGVDDYVDLGNHPSLAPERFTLALWLFPEASFASRTVIQKGDASVEDYRFELFGAKHPTFSFGQGLERVVLYSDLVLNRQEWAHIALVRERNQAALYVDGVQVLSKTFTFSPSATEHALVIGGADTAHYQGKIDDVRLYGFPLSDEEIGHLVSEPE